MKDQDIRRAFLNNPDDHRALPVAGLRPAAALVPLEPEKGVWLTRRSALLPTHSGQVSFPGGKIESSDASPEAAALRETQEEIGLDPAKVNILGRLSDFVTLTGFHIIPVVALLPPGVSLLPTTMEVDEVFNLPFSVLLNPAYPVQRKAIIHGKERVFSVWPHQDHVIWGATAEMLRWLAQRLRAVQ